MNVSCDRSIKRLGYVPATKAELASRALDTNAGLALERMNQKMRLLEKKLGDTHSSPSKSRDVHRSPQQLAVGTDDRLVGKLLLRVEDCERQIDRLKYSSAENHQNNPISTVDLKSNIKALGKNTSKAFRQLSAGVEDVQQATLLLYEWADKVHNAFETVSYKLEYPTNICPRVQVHMHRQRLETEAGKAGVGVGDFVFSDII